MAPKSTVRSCLASLGVDADALRDCADLSEEWGVGEVKPLKKLSEEERKSYPSWDEPSDHVMIWADVEMGDARPAAAA